MRRKRKSSLNLAGKIMLAANLLAIFLLLGSYLAPFVNPAVFWPVAFLGLAYPFLLIINIGFVIYWLIARPKFSLLSAVTIIIGWNFVLSQIGFRGSGGASATPPADAIRIMTFNVHYFKKVTETYNTRNDKFMKDQMLDIIRREQPDIVCFQEFMSHSSGEFNMERSVKEILHSNYVYFLPFNKQAYERIGLAIFSKFPLTAKGSILFSETERGNEAIYTDLNLQGKTLRIYNVHFQSIAFQPDDYRYMKKVEEINPSVQAAKQIGGRIKRAFIKRSEQVNSLKKHTEECAYPFIIAGDFNDTPISYALNTMAKGLKNAFREKGSGFGNTYNGDFPNFQIDYILTSPHFDIKNYHIIKEKLSDHYPVRSDIALK